MLDKLKKYLDEKLFIKFSNDCSKKLEDEKKAEELVIPVPKVTDGQKPAQAAEHDTFNVIMSKGGLMYRVKSESSKEVFRMSCTGHDYKIGSAAMSDYHPTWIEEEKLYHFICRVFVTSNNHYFYQYIRGDGSARYSAVEREDLQEIVKTCESDEKLKIFNSIRNAGYRSIFSLKPGTYSKETSIANFIDFIGYDGMETIDSYEIANPELYDSIIEDL